MKKSKFSAETVKKNLNGWKEELVNFYNDWLVIIKAHLAAADTTVISHEKVREEMDSINRKYDFLIRNKSSRMLLDWYRFAFVVQTEAVYAPWRVHFWQSQ